MLNNILVEIYERDLGKVMAELNAYEDERLIWQSKGQITNTAGNLALHIIGNLNHFIGSVLGSNGYVRNREKEFSEKFISRTELISMLEDTINMVKSVLEKLSEDSFEKDYPIELFNKKMSTAWFMIHLNSHLNYHLGQINYHRRLIKNQI